MVRNILLLVVTTIIFYGCGGSSSDNNSIDSIVFSGDDLAAFNEYKKSTGFNETKELIINNDNINYISGDDDEILFSIGGIEFTHTNTDIRESEASSPSLNTESLKRKITSIPPDGSALILLPFDSEFDEDEQLIYLKSIVDGYFKNVMYLKDNDVTVERISSVIHNFDFIYISTHGAKSGMLITGDERTIDTKKYPYLVNTNRGRIGLKPSFFSQLNSNLNAKIFIANACKTANKSDLSNALLNKGVNIFIGWDDYITSTNNLVGDYLLFKIFSQCEPFNDIAEITKQNVINDPENPREVGCFSSGFTLNLRRILTYQKDCSGGKMTLEDMFSHLKIRRSSDSNDNSVYLNSSCLQPETPSENSQNEYTVYGGDIDFIGGFSDMPSSYTLLGKGSGEKTFNGSYKYYTIANVESESPILIDAVQGSDDTYFRTFTTSNTGDTFVNLGGAPDQKYVSISDHGYILIDASQNTLSSLKVFGK